MKNVKIFFNSFFEIIEEEDRRHLAATIFKELGRKCYLKNREMVLTAKKLHDKLPDFKNKETLVNYLADNMEGHTFTVNDRGFTVDLNNRKCFCPMVNQGYIDDPLLCECTGGFDKYMYEDILGRPVEVRILTSLLGDGSSCKFSVIIK